MAKSASNLRMSDCGRLAARVVLVLGVALLGNQNPQKAVDDGSAAYYRLKNFSLKEEKCLRNEGSIRD
jgi:hypothetical protein